MSFDPNVRTTVAPGPNIQTLDDQGAQVIPLHFTIEAGRKQRLKDLVRYMEHPFDKSCPWAQAFRDEYAHDGVILVFKDHVWDRGLTARMLERPDKVKLGPGHSVLLYCRD